MLLMSGCGSGSTVDAGSSAGAEASDDADPADLADDEDIASEFQSIAHRFLGARPGIGTSRTATQLTSFDELEPVAPSAEMDWENEVVFQFTLAHSDQCPVGEFQGLEFFAGDLRLYPVFSDPNTDPACADVTDPYSVAVAVARSDLPKGEFSIWIERSDPTSEEVNQASYFAAGELMGPDPSTVEFPPLTASGDLEVGETRVGYSITTHCGLDIIFRSIAGRQWQLADGSATGIDYVPTEWQDFVRGQEIDLVLTRTGDSLLEVAPLGSDETRPYEPIEDGEIGCD